MEWIFFLQKPKWIWNNIPNNFSRKTNFKQEYEPSNFVLVPSLLFFLLKIYEPETILAGVGWRHIFLLVLHIFTILDPDSMEYLGNNIGFCLCWKSKIFVFIEKKIA